MLKEESFESKAAFLSEQLNWAPSFNQLEQFFTFQAQLRKWNLRVNLSKLVEGDDYWISQVLDCLWPLKQELKKPYQKIDCIDIGTGCGFPGLAVAIAFPKAKLTLVDSLKRKTSAIKEIVKALGLSSRVQVRTERAESTGQNHDFRGQYDLAMARAVAKSSIVAEYLVPLLKSDGEALLFRGNWRMDDEESLRKAIEPLKVKIQMIESHLLPGGRGQRHQIRLKPISKCPLKYPRAIGIPKRKPLGPQTLESLS